MTRVAGFQQLRVPCCGQVYIKPNYLSMNFMASEHWTDGLRTASLMPNETGLRRCQCGQFLLMHDTEFLGLVESAENLTHLPCPKAHELDEYLTASPKAALEIAARTELWWHHNHPYRQSYRDHRNAEEQASRQAWEAAQPDQRTWWDKFRGKAAPQYQRPSNAPFTIPPFEPTSEQLSNMTKLCVLLEQEASEFASSKALMLAELYREQSLWQQAQDWLDKVSPEEQQHQPFGLMQKMLHRQTAAPMRYRA
ncbi:MAG: hypothetical protein ITG01_08665 [Comamonas sp.]|nr:hypothetical protein [Comamonas sp.]